MGRESYVELEIRGSSDEAIGFVEGYRLGTEKAEKVWFAHRERIEGDSIADSLRERLGSEVRVIVPATMADRLEAAFEESTLVEARVAQRIVIECATLPIEYRCFSREEAEGIRRLVEQDLPDGVELRDYEADEKIEKDAEGVELYSPVHDYILTGKGEYVGPVDGVLQMSHRLDEQSFVHPGKVHLRRST